MATASIKIITESIIRSTTNPSIPVSSGQIYGALKLDPFPHSAMSVFYFSTIRVYPRAF